MPYKKTSLVTGGAGFIGSHVTNHLLKLGHTVVVLDDLSGGFKDNVNKDCVFIKGSISDELLLDSLFKKYSFEYLYHLAAYAAEGLSHFIRKFNYENNVVGSINLINRAIKYEIKHFVFTSSIAVYGTNQVPMLESLTPKPEDPYGIAKYAVEQDLMAAHEMFGLTYTIFRPHNVYGERQNLSDPYRNVLGIFIRNTLQGKPMTIFGDGTQTRAFTYIGDVAGYIAKAVEVEHAKNEIFNIGADKVISILELSEKIAAAFDIKPKVEFLPPRKEVIQAFSNHDKFRKVFNVNNEVEINEGINKMVAWAKTVVLKEPRKFENIELTKNLPPSWKDISNSI